MAEGCDRNGKAFVVTDNRDGRKHVISFEKFSNFEETCKQRFGYSEDMQVIFETDDEEHTEVDKSAFANLENKTKLRIRNVHASSWSTPEIERLTAGADYIRSELSRRGNDKLEGILMESMNIQLRPLSICVTGGSGQGKSLLINAMRGGLSSGDDGYAPVGITETTLECTSYVHPKNKDIVFWDVPGAGTKRFPKDEYLSKIGFEKYDFYIICSATRFSENDNWLFNEVIKQNKRCFFVRTKINVDISNSKLDLGEGFDKDKVKEAIRQECEDNLCNKCPVFLINSHDRFQYDFPKFMNALIMDAPLEQQRSLVCVLESLSREIIEKKAVFLKSEVWKFALILTITKAATPIYKSYIKKVISTYEQQFELTDANIKRYADMISVSLSDLKREANLKVYTDYDSLLVTSMGVLPAINKLTGKESMKTRVPVLGMIALSAYVTYWLTGDMLTKFIDDMKMDAISMYNLVAKNLENNKLKQKSKY